MGIAFGVSGAFPIVYGPVEVCRINGANSLIILVFLHYSSARPCPTVSAAKLLIRTLVDQILRSPQQSSADCFLQPRAPSSLHFTFFKRRINSFIKTFYTSQIVIMKNIALTFAAAFIAGAAAEIHSVVVGGLEGGNPKLVFEPNVCPKFSFIKSHGAYYSSPVCQCSRGRCRSLRISSEEPQRSSN